jgi:hypothetical protein
MLRKFNLPSKPFLISRSAPATYLPSRLATVSDDVPDAGLYNEDGGLSPSPVLPNVSTATGSDSATPGSLTHMIHTANLPLLNDSLDHALTVLETNVSPWTSPTEWIQADAQHILSIVNGLAAIIDTNEIECAMFNGAVPYQVSRA